MSLGEKKPFGRFRPRQAKLRGPGDLVQRESNKNQYLGPGIYDSDLHLDQHRCSL